MRLSTTRVRLLVSLGLLAVAGAPARAQETPTYTNAEVLSVNLQQRQLVIRNNDGAEQTLELDENVAGIGDVRRGDKVILTLRGEPGRPRVKALTRSTPSAPSAPARRAAPPEATGIDEETATREDAFARRVAEVAAQADSIDRLWSSFRTSCNVDLSDGAYEGAREWLSLWEADALTLADVSSGFCRDLFNQIVARGQSVNAAMVAAETEARRTLSPGRIREIEKRYSLDWAGWGRTAPARLATP